MNILIVHAHPEPQSFTTAMKDLAVEHFEEQGHSVQVSDLYEMKWNPVASADDFKARVKPDYLVYALEQRNGYKTSSLAPDIQEEVDKLIWAQQVIFSFPVYWCSVPAIMKGWIDRVLLSGIVYGGLRFYDRGGMAGKKAVVACTVGGQEHMFAKNGIHGPINDMLKHLLQGTLGYAGFDVPRPFVGWHVPYLNDVQRTEILDQYRRYLAHLDRAELLVFPKMEHFDERLYPLPDNEA